MSGKKKQMPVTLGITGGIGCGKSAAGDVLESLNVAVLDADHEVHRLMRKGMPLHDRIVAAFGPEMVGADGEIDRSRLAAMVFPDPSKLDRLNSLTHPDVLMSCREWAAARREEGRDAAVIIPLLHEVGESGGWDAVICIAAEDDIASARLRARGMSDRQIAERRNAQMPLAEKCSRSDYVISNNGTLEELKNDIEKVLEEIKSKRKRAL